MTETNDRGYGYTCWQVIWRESNCTGTETAKENSTLSLNEILFVWHLWFTVNFVSQKQNSKKNVWHRTTIQNTHHNCFRAQARKLRCFGESQMKIEIKCIPWHWFARTNISRKHFRHVQVFSSSTVHSSIIHCGLSIFPLSNFTHSFLRTRKSVADAWL